MKKDYYKEGKKEYQRQYREKHKEEHKDWCKRYRLKNKDILKEKARQNYIKNIDKFKEYSKTHKKERREVYTKWALALKQRVMEKYGNSHCLFCGEKDIAILSIDHVNDDGYKERKNGINSGNEFYRILNKEPRREDLQVLCMNCQYRKRFYGKDMSKWPRVAVLCSCVVSNLPQMQYDFSKGEL